MEGGGDVRAGPATAQGINSPDVVEERWRYLGEEEEEEKGGREKEVYFCPQPR